MAAFDGLSYQRLSSAGFRLQAELSTSLVEMVSRECTPALVSSIQFVNKFMLGLFNHRFDITTYRAIIGKPVTISIRLEIG